MAADDVAHTAFLADLWSLVEEWSSEAIRQARAAATDGASEVVDAEIRVLIAHAADLRGVLEDHLDRAAVAPAANGAAVDADPAAALAPLFDPPLAQVCQECFTMVRLDEVDEHDQVCVKHSKIERMDRAAEEPDEAPDDEDVAGSPVEEYDAVSVAVAFGTTYDVQPTSIDPAAKAASPVTAYVAPVTAAPAPTPKAVPTVPDHQCNSADFERPLCPVCNGLHWYCSICGQQRDECKIADPMA